MYSLKMSGERTLMVLRNQSYGQIKFGKQNMKNTKVWKFRDDWKVQIRDDLCRYSIIRGKMGVFKVNGMVFRCREDANNFKNDFDHFGGQNLHFSPKLSFRGTNWIKSDFFCNFYLQNGNFFLKLFAPSRRRKTLSLAWQTPLLHQIIEYLKKVIPHCTLRSAHRSPPKKKSNFTKYSYFSYWNKIMSFSILTN